MERISLSHVLTDQCQLRRIDADTTLLIQAGASGMGLLLIQWAKHLGARVITTISNETKAQIVREIGADLYH